MPLLCCSVGQSYPCYAAPIKTSGQFLAKQPVVGTESNTSINFAQWSSYLCSHNSKSPQRQVAYLIPSKICFGGKNLCIPRLLLREKKVLVTETSDQRARCPFHHCWWARSGSELPSSTLFTAPPRPPSHPWKSLGWITPHPPPVTNMDIPTWLSYQLVNQILGSHIIGSINSLVWFHLY